MNIDRRDFLKGVFSSGAAAILCVSSALASTGAALGAFPDPAEMKGRKILRIAVKSEKGGRFRLVDSWHGAPLLPQGWQRGRTRNSGEPTLERDFAPGESAELVFGGN